MTLVQLEYIVAVDTYKSFVAAAEKCFVTQPTLSMQIQKLEDFLEVKIFDRSKQPIVATEIGALIILQARKVIAESNRIKEIISQQQNEVYGEFKIGIIPTIAPYLLPEIIAVMMEKYPKLNLNIWEYTTDDIVHHLQNNTIDCGILATPLSNSSLYELPLYYEPFVAYLSEKSAIFNQKQLNAKDFEHESIWLLNEGHCMRSQVLNICRVPKAFGTQSLTYQTGSVETLIRMVDINKGSTLLPQLALKSLNEEQMEKVRFFKEPEPVREISLVTHQNFVKHKILKILENEIRALVPQSLVIKRKKNVVPI